MKILSFTLTLLKILGILPKHPYGKWYNGVSLFFITVLCVHLIPLISYSVVQRKDLIKFASSFYVIGAFGLSIIKYISHIYFKSQIGALIGMMQTNVDKRVERNDHFVEAEKENTIIAKLLLTSTIICLISYSFGPLYWIVKNYKYGTGELELPFQMEFFIDVTQRPIFDIVYTLTTVSCTILIVVVVALDSLFFGMCLYMTAHFKDVQLMITMMDEEFNEMIKHHEILNIEKTEKFLRKKLREIMIYHKKIINYVDIIQDTMGKTIFLQYFCCGFLMLSSIFQITLSTAITNCIYNCNWYSYPIRIQKMLIIFLCRCQKPCVVTALTIFPCSVETWMSICKAVSSALAVLRSMTD